MTVKWKGSKAIQLQRVESKWTTQRGWETVYTYIGEKSLIAAAATNNAYVQYATDVQVVPDRNISELRVSFASVDNSQPDQYTEDSNVWTMQPSMIQKNMEEHPNYVGLADISGEDGYLQRILLAIEDYKEEVKTGISAGNSDANKVFALSNYITLKGTSAQQDLANELAGLLVRGHTTYDTTKYTIQNVIVVPPNTNLTVSHFKTNNQWSTAKLIDWIGAGTPSVTQSSIIGDLIGTFPTDKWLKQAPTIREVNDKKFEIATEWLNVGSDELPTEIYPDYT